MTRDEERIFVGVLRMAVQVRGARSLKDRRQVLVSIRDRMRHRYDVTFHEVGEGADAGHRVVVVTTAGNDGRMVRSVLDQCARMVEEHPVAMPSQVDVDVFRWQPSGDDWASRMMAELGTGGDTDE